MIRSSGIAKAAALTVAIVAHGALVMGLTATDTTEIEGAGTTADVRLGSAFKDLAAGTLQAQTPSAQSAPPATAEKITPQRAEPAKTQTAKAAAKAQTPQVTPPATPNGTLSAAPAKTEPPQNPEPTKQASTPRPNQATPDTPTQRIDGAEPETPAVTRSLRPKTRSAAFEAAHKQRPTPEPKRKPQKKTAKPKAKPAEQGNATRNARAGEATGKTKATARQSGSGGNQKETGNAAASNYPGLVMRKLSRAGKPRVNARGAAVVAFSIGGNGRLTSVSLARSSGSSSLDRAALRLVQRAGPFPKPPRGAQRRFSIQIKGR
ncbi:TonB family protein [Roseovarius sp. A21]|uniref:TonB family protein n=1 Tax=Roseovarius bejariae TaxID=2576383 RepID=A0A844CP49_9RHOB|nr:TonB family protein [Roseovarius bejariae]MRU16607.1 TonB family protein [Roseovarius bejariae]